MEDLYNNGPEGMPRMKRMPDAVLECLIRDSLFRYLANGLEGENLDRLHGLMHDVAEEVLARVPAWSTSSQLAQGDAVRDAEDADRWRRWLPWIRTLSKLPFNLAKEISMIDSARATHPEGKE